LIYALTRNGVVVGLGVGAVNANPSQLASTSSQDFLRTRAEALAAAWLRELGKIEG
jgi:hypothetical protein